MIYYDFIGYEHISDTHIEIKDIKRILSECKIIDIEVKEPLPEGKVTFVGVGNDKYECRVLWDMKYTDHMKLTYGGYFNEDHSGYNAWWTMNYNYSDLYDKTKMYIVNNRDDGEKLAAFLNFTHGFNNIQNIIYQKEDEIKKLQEDLNYLQEANKIINYGKNI